LTPVCADCEGTETSHTGTQDLTSKEGSFFVFIIRLPGGDAKTKLDASEKHFVQQVRGGDSVCGFTREMNFSSTHSQPPNNVFPVFYVVASTAPSRECF